MNLLDRVLEHGSESLHAAAASHRAADNPLRRDGRLSAAAGIEYAAQAMAVHGALAAGPDGGARPGYLALARDVRWHAPRLDDIAEDLEIRVRRLAAQTASAMYEFSIEAGGRPLVEGRVAVFFPPPDLDGAGP
jgi:predicted hotdog family 3-hydroxylacyl-ACP dehydratase